MVRLLLDNGADINGKTKPHEAIALHQAVLFKKPNIMAFLIERGAEIDARDTY
jgi:ankyrin repeat protein